jgi:hypothetical protein
MNSTDCFDFLAVVKMYSERLSPQHRLDQCYRFAEEMIGIRLRGELVNIWSRGEARTGRVEILSRIALNVHTFERCIRNFQWSPSSKTFVDRLSVTANKIVIASLARETLAMFSLEASFCEASLKSDRSRRQVLKEYGGRQNLGEAISKGLLEIFEAKAILLIKKEQYKVERAAAAANFLSSEEMEEAGIVAVGPMYECNHCGDDHHEDDCDEYYSGSDDDEDFMFW